MRIAICDDDVILCHQLEGIILGFGKNEDVPVQTSVFFDGKGLWKYMKQGNHFDLIFLDIEMEQMNGIAVGRAIRDTLGDEECKIVFISSRRDYAIELFAIRPMDFLVKPVTQEKLKAIWELYSRLYQKEQNVFYYQVKGNKNYIAFSRILYFRADNRKIEIHTIDRDVVTFYGKMSEVKRQTDAGRFIQISRSELVNYNAVEEYREHMLILRGGERLLIVASRRKTAGLQISDYMGEMMKNVGSDY
jgi:DNA-binding LytR/AlgR family response regulator